MGDFVIRELESFYNLKFLDKYLIGHRGYIAGGCFKNIFNHEKVKDIDIFFESKEEWDKAVVWYSDQANGYYSYYSNDKVNAYKEKEHNEITIELVKSRFDTPQNMLDYFDFTITKFAFYKEIIGDGSDLNYSYKIIHHNNFFEHLHRKILVTNPIIHMPVGTFERMLKYAKYGYFPCKETKGYIIKNLRENIIPNDDISNSLYLGLD